MVRLKTGDGAVVGAIVLGIDPSIPRYRLMLAWPSDSQSGEVILARRDGDSTEPYALPDAPRWCR